MLWTRHSGSSHADTLLELLLVVQPLDILFQLVSQGTCQNHTNDLNYGDYHRGNGNDNGVLFQCGGNLLNASGFVVIGDWFKGALGVLHASVELLDCCCIEGEKSKRFNHTY